MAFWVGLEFEKSQLSIFFNGEADSNGSWIMECLASRREYSGFLSSFYFPLELVELIFCALVLNFLCALVLGFPLLPQDSFQIRATSGSVLSRQSRR